MKGLFILLVLVGIGLALGLVGGLSTKDSLSDNPNPQKAGIAVQPPPVNGKNNLQLKTFPFITPTPAPTGGTCQVDNAKTNGCTCISYENTGVVCPNKASGRCPDATIQGTNNIGYGIDCSAWPKNLQDSWGCDANSCIYVQNVPQMGGNVYDKYKDCSGGHAICFGKPVIYLYPTQDTYVDVTLSIPGTITTSIPDYDQQLGWNHVLAHPNGELEYQGNTYSELFYETSVTKSETPTAGVYIRTTELKDQLTKYTTQLDLLPKEQEELLNYWLPKLYTLNKPYIFFSILSPEQKETVDHVDIFPQPKTRIEFLMYFKGSDQQETIDPLVLPSTPRRIGFTEVEWGGTIAQ